MFQTNPPRPPSETLPTMYDLPSKEIDEPGVPDEFERILRVPYYIVFDRDTDQLRAFQLMPDQYHEMQLEQPKVWMPTLELELGL